MKCNYLINLPIDLLVSKCICHIYIILVIFSTFYVVQNIPVWKINYNTVTLYIIPFIKQALCTSSVHPSCLPCTIVESITIHPVNLAFTSTILLVRLLFFTILCLDCSNIAFGVQHKCLLIGELPLTPQDWAGSSHGSPAPHLPCQSAWHPVL